LLDAELFGHARGAFTGALRNKGGLFQAADGGTLFLDQVESLSPRMQVRLLRAVQDGEIRPVGQSQAVHVDVRLLCSTQLDLKTARDQGSFREDLYYRMAVITLVLPPLRERMEDVPCLCRSFLWRYAGSIGKRIDDIDPDALLLLTRYSWPGNVRELENVIERACVLGAPPAITPADLPKALHAVAEPGVRHPVLCYRDARDQEILAFERRFVSDLLRRTTGNLCECARLAGLDRSNFRRILRRCGVSPDEYRSSPGR
jgi:two-component system response regulator HydG